MSGVHFYGGASHARIFPLSKALYPTNMNIREATKDDAFSIANIHVKAWQSGYKELMSKDYLDSLSIELKTKQWSESLSKIDIGTTLCIELNQSVVGFSVFGPLRDNDLSNRNFGELVALNILPEHWNKGLGSEFAKYIIDASHQRKWNALYLWVLKGNDRATKLYEKFGFIKEGSEKTSSKLTGNSLHEVRYIKKLHNV